MILSALALVASTFASPLRGVVTDASGLGVAGATVSLTRSRLSTTTGPDGSWSIARVSAVNPRQGDTALPRNLRMVDGHLGLDYSGFDARGNRLSSWRGVAIPGSGAAARASSSTDTGVVASDTGSFRDTLVAALGSRVTRSVVDLADTAKIPSLVLDTQALELRASATRNAGLRCLSMMLTNQGSKVMDTLQIRLFLNGTAQKLRDLGGRLDIAIQYDADGFGRSSASNRLVDSAVRSAHPVRMAATAPSDTAAIWSWTIDLPGVALQPQSRLRLDLVMDRHKLEVVQGDTVVSDVLLNQPPTWDIVDGWNWSTGRHASPAWYPGVPTSPDGTGSLLDGDLSLLPVAPYIQVLRSGVRLQGIAPDGN